MHVTEAGDDEGVGRVTPSGDAGKMDKSLWGNDGSGCAEDMPLKLFAHSKLDFGTEVIRSVGIEPDEDESLFFRV